MGCATSKEAINQPMPARHEAYLSAPPNQLNSRQKLNH